MGVADNRTYKQEYHFTDDYKKLTEDYPSIHEEPKINTTIKENPYRSNVEIEGGEMVLQPDLTAIFKAKGKRHHSGGMNVLLKPNSFIYSDFKDLALNDEDLEMFELKGGKTNTPADILRKNINTKHYNKMVEILDNPYKDDLSKKTAAMMLEKYIQTLGNIAYIQEDKKRFPQGIPEFSIGTAPVYNPELKEDIEANKQYMKAGGRINPYMQPGGNFEDMLNKIATENAKGTNRRPKNPNAVYNEGTGKWYVPENSPAYTPPQQGKAPVDEWGPWPGDTMPLFQDRFGTTNAADKLPPFDRIADILGYSGPKNNLAFQKWLYNSSPENKSIIDKWHTKYGQPNAGQPFDKKIGIRWQSAIKEILTTRPPANTPKDFSIGPRPNVSPNVPRFENNPTAPNVEVTSQGSKQADWRFTPWQRLSQFHNLGQWANVKRYMPYRSRYNATYVDPALVNPEQAVGDIQAAGNQQLSAISTLNPVLRNAQAASVAGQIMNQVPGVRAQYDNQNAQILNQTRQFNNQIRNNESLVNMGNDQQYYTQAIEGRKNFDNMRQYLSNNYMNNLLRDVETNQKLSYNLLTQNNPAYGFDWKTGNFYRNPKNILDVETNNINNRYQALQDMLDQITDPTEKVKQAIKLEGIKAFSTAQPSPVFKKGGKMKSKNPYRY